MHCNHILFVCLGNICRSPTAHAVFRQIAENASMKLDIDSAGTSAYHAGEGPDPRSRAAGERRGYSFQGIYSRGVTLEDFEKFDLILAMDKNNLKELLKSCPEAQKHKVKLFLDYSVTFSEQEVPDPYYGGERGFEHVLDLIEDASRGLLNEISQ
ncbi:low molecular weight protein-tyrosine-phosphatase [Algicola sagamiensis]|uniref:low molecular weight protein-tyrosine-phosphatase n=1 Tax=Algicola sagamiensis TaxID=163869 RepID=UPI00037323CA